MVYILRRAVKRQPVWPRNPASKQKRMRISMHISARKALTKRKPRRIHKDVAKDHPRRRNPMSAVIRIDEPTHETLRELSKDCDESMSVLVAQAVKDLRRKRL